jgi:hypothetical protein
MGINEFDQSTLVALTVDGLRVAVAGLSPDMPADVQDGVVVAATVADLRTLTELPQPLQIRIPYRVSADSRVKVQAVEHGEQ